MEIALIVVRTATIEKLVSFYTSLGLEFEYHKPGSTPFYYSAQVGKGVLEIHPLAKGQLQADSNLRLGFRINNFENIIDELKEAEVNFVMQPASTEDWGIMAIVTDPDGRKIELYEK